MRWPTWPGFGPRDDGPTWAKDSARTHRKSKGWMFGPHGPASFSQCGDFLRGGVINFMWAIRATRADHAEGTLAAEGGRRELAARSELGRAEAGREIGTRRMEARCFSASLLEYRCPEVA
jgi:hypothetical protein